MPRVLAQVRAESYAAYAWPRFLAPMFARNGLAISLVAALSVAAFILGFAAWHDAAVLFGTHTGPGAFYRLMPHNAMAATVRRASSSMRSSRSPWACARSGAISATRAARRSSRARCGRRSATPAQLRYLDGGGIGCYNDDERPNDRRRFYHHQTFYGFMLCFASTCVATLYHYALGRVAPYPLVGPAGACSARSAASG